MKRESSRALEPTPLRFPPQGGRLFLPQGGGPGGGPGPGPSVLPPPIDVSTFGYENISFSVSPDATVPNTVEWAPDGSRFFVMDQNDDGIWQYTCVSPWLMAGATNDGLVFTSTAQETTPQGFTISADGLKLFVCGLAGRVFQYSITTAWDLSSAITYDSISLDTSGQTGNPQGMCFSNDGSLLFVCEGNDVYLYNCPTAFTVDGASYASNTFASAQEATLRCVRVSNDGTQMLLLGTQFDTIFQYTMSPNDPSSAVYDNKSLLVSAQDGNPFHLYVRPDGTKLYMVGWTDAVYQYGPTLAASSYDGASFDYTIIGTGGRPEAIRFSPDGLLMCVVDRTDNGIYQWPLSTAFDPSSAGAQTFTAFTDGVTLPRGFCWGDSGNKLLVVKAGTNFVYQYSMSTPYDPSTMTYDSISFSAAVELASSGDQGTGIFWSTDGLKVFVLGGGAGGRVYSYTCPVAHSISGATYDGNATGRFSYPGFQGSDLHMSPDGTQMFLSDDGNDAVERYVLETPWILGSVVDPADQYMQTEEAQPYGLTFTPDGSKFFIVGWTNDTVFRYSTVLSF